MYKKVECICITCDNCGQAFRDENTGFSIFVDENGAHEASDNRGWYSEDGKHYCPKCNAISFSTDLAMKRIKQAINYGKYKGWESVAGQEQAQAIMDDFHKGVYGSKNLMSIQVDEAVEMLETFIAKANENNNVLNEIK